MTVHPLAALVALVFVGFGSFVAGALVQACHKVDAALADIDEPAAPLAHREAQPVPPTTPDSTSETDADTARLDSRQRARILRTADLIDDLTDEEFNDRAAQYFNTH